MIVPIPPSRDAVPEIEGVDRVGELSELRSIANAEFFGAAAERLARLCERVAGRFSAGGRLIAVGCTPQARSDAHVLPAPAESARVNFLNSAQVERMTPENLLNAAPYSENLLNAANGLRAMGY